MTPAISQGIVGVQVALLLLALIIGLASRSQGAAKAMAWISTVLALVVIALAGIASAPGAALGATGEAGTWITYGVIGFLASAVTWGAVAVVGARIRLDHERYLARPETRAAMGEELRTILREEGIELDARLKQAEADREQFIYALEDRHAAQIRSLAEEYQHEAQAILVGMVEQLGDSTLRPMVEERLATHRTEIEAELEKLDADAGAEAIAKVRAEYRELTGELSGAEERIAKLREENPDVDMGELVQRRFREVDAQIDKRVEDVSARLDGKLSERMDEALKRVDEVGDLLDEKVAAAESPLVRRMAETEEQVAQQFDAWLEVLEGRFGETEQLLNQRVAEQETSLEQRVGSVETALEERLAQHVEGVEEILRGHDEQLHAALQAQSEAIGEHYAAERDRLVAEMGEHSTQLQESVAAELVAAEQRAHESVEATQAAWNEFTTELEQRFEETREEAARAAHEVAEAERSQLMGELESLTSDASSEIASRVEQLQREAAWQRERVDRIVEDTMQGVRARAEEALENADEVFQRLESDGEQRVERIRRDAEDALVQSRDYVEQLHTSLGEHLEALRTRSEELADEMNDRLGSITEASQQSASQLEQYARDLVEATTRELAGAAEHGTQELQAKINGEFMQLLEGALETQRASYERHLAELAQRTVQEVQGDLAGAADHARNAVIGDIDQLITQSREHAQQAQDQAFREVLHDLARQQSELGDQARGAADGVRRQLEDGLRDNRRQLEEAMASMGAHMREELVRFNDEGQRRVQEVIDRLRGTEQELIREEDQRMRDAREDLVRQHQGALENQVRSMVDGLAGTLTNGPAGATPSFTGNIGRPATPLQGQGAPAPAPAQQQQHGAGQPQPGGFNLG